MLYQYTYYIPIHGLQFSADFYKIWFSGIYRSSLVTWCQKIRKNPESGKIRTKYFSGFFWEWLLHVIFDIRVFLFFRNSGFQSHYSSHKVFRFSRRTVYAEIFHLKDFKFHFYILWKKSRLFSHIM